MEVQAIKWGSVSGICEFTRGTDRWKFASLYGVLDKTFEPFCIKRNREDYLSFGR
jgi:hypothetical protein